MSTCNEENARRSARKANPWTVDAGPNPHYSDEWSTVYTLRWCGLVRGQLVDRENAERICAQLNLTNMQGELAEALRYAHDSMLDQDEDLIDRELLEYLNATLAKAGL